MFAIKGADVSIDFQGIVDWKQVEFNTIFVSTVNGKMLNCINVTIQFYHNEVE